MFAPLKTIYSVLSRSALTLPLSDVPGGYRADFLFQATIIAIRTTIGLLFLMRAIFLEMTIFATIIALDLGNVLLSQL